MDPSKTYKNIIGINPNDLDWPFPDKCYNSIGYTVHGFNFKFKNLPNELATIIDPSSNLINTETNTETVDSTLTRELFSKKPKEIEDKIKEYNAIPTKNCINERFFYTTKVTRSKRHL